MFGFGKKKRLEETITLVSAVLKPIYEVHFGRAQPANLARVLVEQSFSEGDLKFGGRTIGSVGAVVHALEALQGGYSRLDIAEQAQSACAAALSLLIRQALTPRNVESLEPHDAEYVALMGSTLTNDRRWQEAMSRVPEGQPATRPAA